ncbi:MAG: ABC transporter substrate-binding protein [Anaerolineae bacterium]|nr:ABC transporter substrate-binding protein [Anaerolineales bacterium]MCQ3979950.1 ABC transporter substrate-binding protein [Anaerolineae bacterium]
MNNYRFTTPLVFLLFTILSLLLTNCAAAAVGSETSSDVVISVPAAQAETAPEGATAPPGYEAKNWADIVTEAKGQTVNWYMWGGQENINTWVTGFVAENVKKQYGVTLNMVPIADTVEAVNKVLGEKEAGQDTAGSVDLIWINGENFRTLRQADLLYGPWARYLPNTGYVNWDDPSVSTDLGLPVSGYESPYGKAQFVMIYDSAKVAQPPATLDGLIEWIKANPGKFTYPAPPDFTGTAFIMHLCYAAAGGHEQFLREFDQTLFDDKFARCWKTLNEIEPFLWRKGQTYPESHARQQDLFANGEVYFDMAYNPAEASSLVEAGKFPQTTRTFIFDSGTIANTHYVAIPYNSPHKAGAMVVANFLLSPEAQHSKADPANWGDFPAIEVSRLPESWQQQFAALPRGVATLPDETLAARRLPELQATWRVAAEKAWEENVLKQ